MDINPKLLYTQKSIRPHVLSFGQYKSFQTYPSLKLHIHQNNLRAAINLLNSSISAGYLVEWSCNDVSSPIHHAISGCCSTVTRAHSKTILWALRKIKGNFLPDFLLDYLWNPFNLVFFAIFAMLLDFARSLKVEIAAE